MSSVHLVVGTVVFALFLAAGVVGAWRWWTVEPGGVFWPLLRAAQVALLVQVALGGLLLALGRRPSDKLHYLYGLLPVAVSFVAEQLRIGAAEAVLATRGFGSAQEVGTRPPDEQRSVVRAIVRREVGVMALAALVICGLVVRAAFTSGRL